MKAITCPVILDGVSTRKDGSLGLRFSTPELDPKGKLAFLEIQNKNCKILIQPDDGEMEAMHEIKGEFDKKSPSQRLRGVLFVLWKHLTDTQQCEISFENFYLRQMETIINNYKEQLPEQTPY